MARTKNPVWEDVRRVSVAFRSSESVTEALAELGLPSSSAQYRNARNFSRTYGIKLPRASGERKLRRANTLRSKTKEELFVENSTTDRSTIKRALIRLGLRTYTCFVCGLDPEEPGTYFGITLELEHKNGVGDDNRLENLEFICPNHHTLTSTYAGRNVLGRSSNPPKLVSDENRSERLSDYSLDELVGMIELSSKESVAIRFETSVNSLDSSLKQRINNLAAKLGLTDSMNDPIKYGSPDGLSYKRVVYPVVETMVQLVEEKGYEGAGREFGVSGSAIRKHLKKHMDVLPSKKKLFRNGVIGNTSHSDCGDR